MYRKKSAKDLAFDKERNKFRSEIKKLGQEINQLKQEIANKDIEMSKMKLELSQKESKIMEQADWIHRLLSYMDLSETDLQKFIEKEKIEYDIIQSIRDLGKVIRRTTSTISKNV